MKLNSGFSPQQSQMKVETRVQLLDQFVSTIQVQVRAEYTQHIDNAKRMHRQILSTILALWHKLEREKLRLYSPQLQLGLRTDRNTNLSSTTRTNTYWPSMRSLTWLWRTNIFMWLSIVIVFYTPMSHTYIRCARVRHNTPLPRTHSFQESVELSNNNLIIICRVSHSF